jgi:predicted Zn-dependent protease
MTLAVVFAFAVEKDLPPVVGAAPYGVLARQLPRLVVNRLNGDRDAGLRFFPLLGTDNGTRQFFTIDEMLPPEQLAGLHGLQGQVPYMIDGKIDAKTLTFRVFEENQLLVTMQTIDFDPLDPLPAATRMLFEMSGVFQWSGAPPALPDIESRALSHFFVAKDDLLCLEAGFPREDDDQWVRAIRCVFDERPEDRDVQTLLLDICRHLVRTKSAPTQVRDLLVHATAVTNGLRLAGEAAAVLDDLGCRDEADALFERLVHEPDISEAVALRLAAFLFRRGRFAEGRDHLERVRARGVAGNRLLAQLAVLYQRLGQDVERHAVIDELANRDNLPPTVSRMVCGELVDQNRAVEALAVIDRCLARSPDDATLWLEKARVLLHGDDPTSAGPVLEEVFRHHPSAAVREEAARLQRFASLPHVLPALRVVDAALAGNHLDRALQLATDLVQANPDLAEGWLFLGVTHQRRESIDEAIVALQKAVTLDTTLGEAHNRLGILLVGAGRHREGAEQLERAIEILPAESGPQIHMAQALALLGDKDAGRRALEEAERLGADPRMVESVRRTFFAENG